MKKRLLAMLLVLALSVSMLTVCASAITPTINLERHESDNGDGWFWNGRTQTLILQGGTIDASDGIYIDCDATIRVKDDTWLEGFIVVDGELTIEGDSWLEISADNETAITAEDDVYMEDVMIQITSGTFGIVCGGAFSAEYCELNGYDLNTFIVAEEIEIYDSALVNYCVDTALFADENVILEWTEVHGVTEEGPVVYAGEDVVIEACDVNIMYSEETSAIWAGDRIRFRDCDLELDVYVDEIEDAEHPLFDSATDVNALFYEDDDEMALVIYAESSITTFGRLLPYIIAEDEGVPEDYNDVSRSDWFSDAVDYVSAKGLMIGTGRKTFSPNETVSNAMAWMILARINDAYTMSEGNWYDAAQSFVVTCGLSDGVNPKGAITREAFITMLFKSNGSYCVRDLSVFADAASVSADAVEAMRWAVENGIIKGVDGKLNPKGYMTRAELAEILMRLG